jgi:RND family efflux transporter MFP subunit
MLNLRSNLLIGFILLIASASVFARPATPVNVVAATISEIFPTSWVSGTVVSNNDAQIAAEVGGRLIHVAQVGDRVVQGDIVAKIDDTVVALQVKELQASVASAKRTSVFLAGEVKRIKGLTQQNLAAKTDLDETISNLDIAKAKLAEQQARLAQTKQRLTYTKILAPFDGVVTMRLSKLGEVVSNGTKVVQLVETVNLEVTAQVPLTVYQFLHQGSEIEVKSPLGMVKAKIRAVVPVANARSHLMELRLTLGDSGWPVGLNVRVAVPSGDTQSLMVVPRDAIILRREGNTVFRINDDNKAEQLPVSLGIASGGVIAVDGEIQVGDKIVIRGSERLRPGQAVAIKDNNDSLLLLQSK